MREIYDALENGDKSQQRLAPDVFGDGTGLWVKNRYASGDVVLAWLLHYADAGYVRRADNVLRAAEDRISHVG